MTNTQRTFARLGLILAAVLAGILNGSPLAAPVLMLAAYMISVLVDQAHTLQAIHTARRIREISHAATLAR